MALALPVLKVLRFLQSRSWEEVASLQLSSPLIGTLESVLGQYIVHQLERAVRSATFLVRLRRGLSQAKRVDDSTELSADQVI